MGARRESSEWSNKDVAAAVAQHFGEEHSKGEIEGPARLGVFRVWRVWTHDGSEYHAHYAVAEDFELLKFFDDFSPFAIWLSSFFESEQLNSSLEFRHRRAKSWVSTIIAACVILVMLWLLVQQIQSGNNKDFNIAYVVTTLLGAGVAYLLTNGRKS